VKTQKPSIFAAGKYKNPTPFTIPKLTTFRRYEIPWRGATKMSPAMPSKLAQHRQRMAGGFITAFPCSR
jgi:hypothetical protein